MLDGIAFDLEGTVVNLEPFHHGAHLNTLRDLGTTIGLTEVIEKIPHFIGGPNNEIAKEIKILTDSKLSIEEIQSIDQGYYKKSRMSWLISNLVQDLPNFSQ